MFILRDLRKIKNGYKHLEIKISHYTSLTDEIWLIIFFYDSAVFLLFISLCPCGLFSGLYSVFLSGVSCFPESLHRRVESGFVLTGNPCLAD